MEMLKRLSMKMNKRTKVAIWKAFNKAWNEVAIGTQMMPMSKSMARAWFRMNLYNELEKIIEKYTRVAK